MSEERIIRINKVLRELNISLERAVDYLKDKGIAIEVGKPQTQKFLNRNLISLQKSVCRRQGNKEASKGSRRGEKKRKRSFAY